MRGVGYHHSVVWSHGVLLYAIARDVTGATWGGSSVPTSEDGEDSTASLPGPGGLDDTREDLDHTYTATLGVHSIVSPGGGGSCVHSLVYNCVVCRVWVGEVGFPT